MLGDEGWPESAQKKEHDHDDQRHREHESDLHVANGRSDRNCSIVHHIQMHTWRQPGPQLREDFVNQIGCANNVSVRLFENDQQHGAFVVEKAGLIAICLRVNCGADIAQSVPLRRYAARQ